MTGEAIACSLKTVALRRRRLHWDGLGTLYRAEVVNMWGRRMPRLEAAGMEASRKSKEEIHGCSWDGWCERRGC